MLLRCAGEQAQRGQPDEKSIRLRAGVQAERGCQRVTLRCGQPSETVEQARAELMQAREGELHLPLHPGCAKDPTAIGALRRVLQEGRFADAGLAPQDQHRAASPLSFSEQLIEPRTLGARGRTGAAMGAA